MAAGLLGSADDVVYRLACETERVLITLNYQDFRLMEKFPPEQCGGILAVRMGHTGLAAVNSVLDRALRHLPESYFSRNYLRIPFDLAQENGLRRAVARPRDPTDKFTSTGSSSKELA